MRSRTLVPLLMVAGVLSGCVYEPYGYVPLRAVPAQVVYAQPSAYSIPADVLFGFNSSVLRPGATEALEQSLASIRQAVPDPAIRVEGDTDSIGSAAYNQDLSLRRARTVAHWLEEHGVPGQAISVAGNGESRPVAPNRLADGADNPQGRALNRRVDLLARPS